MIQLKTKHKKIAFIGAHGVGKSTIVKALSQLPEFKDYHIINEVARDYLNENNLKIEEIIKNQDSFLEFELGCLKRQSEQEKDKESFISDRSLFDILGYSTVTLDEKNFATIVKEADKYDFDYFICLNQMQK